MVIMMECDGYVLSPQSQNAWLIRELANVHGRVRVPSTQLSRGDDTVHRAVREFAFDHGQWVETNYPDGLWKG